MKVTQQNPTPMIPVYQHDLKVLRNQILLEIAGMAIGVAEMSSDICTKRAFGQFARSIRDEVHNDFY